MSVRLVRLLAALPLVVFLGAALACAASPEGDVTAREREVVARLTRGGVQRFDAEGTHGTADGVDAADAGTPSTQTPAPDQSMTASGPDRRPRLPLSTMLDLPAVRLRAGRPSMPPGRGRAPPRR